MPNTQISTRRASSKHTSTHEEPALYLSNRIKQIMKDQKIRSIKDLSRRIGVAPSSVRGILAGTSKPNSRTYASYAAFLGLDPAQLRLRLEGTQLPTPDEHPPGITTDLNTAVRAIEDHGIRRMLSKFSNEGIHILRSLSTEDAARVVAYARRLQSAKS